MTDGTIWEWAHRLLAFLIAPLLVALVAVGWRERLRSPFIAPTVITIAAIFLAQVLLGAATVRFSNSPASVVLHWAMAMALIAALSAMTIFAAAARPDAAFNRSSTDSVVLLAGTAALAFGTMCIGAYVSSSGAGLACLSIPGCAGNVVVYSDGQIVQLLHRIAAAATLLAAAGSLAFVWARPTSARVRTAVSIGVGLVGLQILLGLLNVALRLPTDLREAHAVNAAVMFLAFVVATIFALVDAPIIGSAKSAAAR